MTEWYGECEYCGAGLHEDTHDCTIQVPKIEADLGAGTDTFQFPTTPHLSEGNENVYVIYMGGQSNLWGTGSLHSDIDATYDPTYKSSGSTTPDNVFIWTKIATTTPHQVGGDVGEWTPLNTGFGFSNPHVYGGDDIGSEMQIAWRIQDRVGEDIPIYFIKMARGGARLISSGGIDWSPQSSGELYDAWREEYHTRGIRALYDAGKFPHALGFCWGQGAGDVKESAAAAAAYATNLQDLINNFRTDIGISDLVISLQRETVNLTPGTWVQDDLDAVRAAQEGFAALDPWTGWFDSDDIEFAGPGPPITDEHFTGNGQVQFGDRFANVLLEYWRYKRPKLIPRP